MNNLSKVQFKELKLNNYLAKVGEEEDDRTACSDCSRRFGNGLLCDGIMAAFNL